MKEKRYSISEASRLLEVENHVLRYWEEELELTIPRNELGHRYYREEEIQLLNCIKELKNKRLSAEGSEGSAAGSGTEKTH